MRKRVLVGGAALFVINITLAFSPLGRTSNDNHHHPMMALRLAKRKVSMAEKRRTRQAKQRGEASSNPFAELPKSKLDFQTPKASAVLDSPEKISDPTAAAEKAKKLLQAQRASVDMLTTVKERVLGLLSGELVSALEKEGYYVVDGLIADENILGQMEADAQSMYENGELALDMTTLGSGEYTVAIQGGQAQYAKCPRLVEWAVSTTRHIPELLDGQMIKLDSSACMATLRTFDRKAFLASLALLTGNEARLDATKAYGVTVADAKEDKRRLSMVYYLVPGSWDSKCGGGISFENGTSFEPKRDRLVIWKSESSSFRNEMWKGSDRLGTPLASCIELHLVEKTEP